MVSVISFTIWGQIASVPVDFIFNLFKSFQYINGYFSLDYFCIYHLIQEAYVPKSPCSVYIKVS